MRLNPGVGSTENPSEHSEIIRVPVNGVRRHPDSFAMLEAMAAIRCFLFQYALPADLRGAVAIPRKGREWEAVPTVPSVVLLVVFLDVSRTVPRVAPVAIPD